MNIPYTLKPGQYDVTGCWGDYTGPLLTDAFSGQQYDLPAELLPPDVSAAQQHQSAVESDPAALTEYGLQLPVPSGQRFDVFPTGSRVQEDVESEPAQQLQHDFG